MQQEISQHGSLPLPSACRTQQWLRHLVGQSQSLQFVQLRMLNIGSGQRQRQQHMLHQQTNDSLEWLALVPEQLVRHTLRPHS
ncbi:unnamed protein product [Haemonchus placei]|uniref:Uncharacterized protein n=1 Tax=Haemonchus placei TaxID=6290 RepID=A0A3P7ZEB3_HAEPC|nr:unnamed protein product [Haemonchus placei]